MVVLGGVAIYDEVGIARDLREYFKVNILPEGGESELSLDSKLVRMLDGSALSQAEALDLCCFISSKYGLSEDFIVGEYNAGKFDDMTFNDAGRHILFALIAGGMIG